MSPAPRGQSNTPPPPVYRHYAPCTRRDTRRPLESAHANVSGHPLPALTTRLASPAGAGNGVATRPCAGCDPRPQLSADPSCRLTQSPPLSPRGLHGRTGSFQGGPWEPDCRGCSAHLYWVYNGRRALAGKQTRGASLSMRGECSCLRSSCLSSVPSGAAGSPPAQLMHL